MERLTKRGNGHAYYPRCFKEPCYGSGCKIKDCPFETEVCECLAAYEDTGLTPEEVLPKDMADEIALKLMRLADLESICSFARLRELAEADKDGRLVVLPCKVGTRVYRIWYKIADYPDEPEMEIVETKFGEGCCEDFGKTVFLTREEAEKALQEMEGRI